MKGFELSALATEDLRSIWSYVARDSVTRADKLIDRLIEVFKLLGRFPGLGDRWRAGEPELRAFPVSGIRYVIFFSPSPNIVRIVRVIHGSRDLNRILPPK